MTRISDAEVFLTATTVGGIATCTLPTKMYRRIVTNMKIQNTVEGEVFVRVGSLSATPTAQHLVGSNNTLRGEIEVPAGQNLFVTWTNAPTPVSAATVNISLDRVEEGDEHASGIITWDAVAAQRSLLAPDLRSLNQNLDIPAGFFGFSTTVDMRAYQSFSVTIDLTYVGVPAGWAGTRIDLVWTDETGRVIFEDNYNMFPASPNAVGAFHNRFNRLEVQDSAHGSFLTVQFVNSNGVNAVTANCLVFGNSRAISRQHVRNTDGTNGATSTVQEDLNVLVNLQNTAINNATTHTYILPISPTRVWHDWLTSQVLFFNFWLSSTNLLIRQVTTVANVEDTREYLFPKNQIRMEVINTSGVVASYNATVIREGFAQ